jgi:hypothetical protein
MLTSIQSANLAVRFLLEIGALIALGYWGFQTGQGLIVKIVLGLGAPLLIGLVWSRFGSAGASMPLSGLPRLILETVIFGLAALGLATADQRSLALAFAVIFAVNRV